MERPAAQVHDLLHIDPDFLDVPDLTGQSWTKKTLASCPWVVALREQARDNRLVVGIRGVARNERLACLVRREAIREIVRPEELLALSGRCAPRTPALIALQRLRERWRNLALPWGPVGSVGFELATGRCVTTAASDLDIAIRALRPITKEYARFLCERSCGLEVRVDIRVEAPTCGFSLEEYALSSSRWIIFRSPEGARLGDDPWQESSAIGGIIV
jgi:phosphoribosyl-dephospho-CoA transferase